MGDFGFRAINDFGAVQVDGDYRNHKLFATGSVATLGYDPVQNPYGFGNIHDIAFPARTNRPILLLQPGAIWAGGGRVADTLDSAQFYTLYEGNGWAPTQVNYALLDEVGALDDSSTYGIRVFNASGQEVFDHRYRYLKVRDVVTLGAPTGTPATLSHANVPNAYYMTSPVSGTAAWISGCPGEPTWDCMYFDEVHVRQASPTSLEYKLATTHVFDVGHPGYNSIVSGQKVLVCEIGY